MPPLAGPAHCDRRRTSRRHARRSPRQGGRDIMLTAHSSLREGRATAQAVRSLGAARARYVCDVVARGDRSGGRRSHRRPTAASTSWSTPASAAFRGVAPEQHQPRAVRRGDQSHPRAPSSRQSTGGSSVDDSGMIVFVADVTVIPASANHSFPRLRSRMGPGFHLTRCLAKASGARRYGSPASRPAPW